MSEITAGPAPAAPSATNGKLRLATVWLSGCSGCHMSFLDLDERLLDVAQAVDLVYSPIADIKEFPEDVDVTLIEGAVANEDNLELLKIVRQRTRVLVAFGDCAVTGNVPALRNLVKVEQALEAAYVRRVSTQPMLPDCNPTVPRLLPRVEPINRVVAVDAYLPGCPPSADVIWEAVKALLQGTQQEPAQSAPVPKFG